jgi:hypothetical protein
LCGGHRAFGSGHWCRGRRAVVEKPVGFGAGQHPARRHHDGRGARQAAHRTRPTQGVVHLDGVVAKMLSAGNRNLSRMIVEHAPGSLDELARITGKAKSNLSRALKAMAGPGLVRLKRSAAFAVLDGVPGGIRTHGPKIRNLVLYPAELRRRHPVIAEIAPVRNPAV